MDFNKYVEMNIPFKEKGRDLGGLDCWGLVKLFYQEELGITLPDYQENYKKTSDAEIADTIEVESEKDWISVDSAINGDVILCRMRGRPMHVGIYKAPHFMLHIERGNTVALEKINNSKWKHRILQIVRPRQSAFTQ
jgi:cell wall-associated NlpC family hydrolase